MSVLYLLKFKSRHSVPHIISPYKFTYTVLTLHNTDQINDTPENTQSLDNFELTLKKVRMSDRYVHWGEDHAGIILSVYPPPLPSLCLSFLSLHYLFNFHTKQAGT